jgi:hypothetical protein
MTETNLPATGSAQMTAATEHLAALLDRIGDALVAVDTAALLAAEAELRQIAGTLGAPTEVDAATVAAARRASAALLRCRRLGASFSGVVRAVESVGRVNDGYDRVGGYIESFGIRPSVQIRA